MSLLLSVADLGIDGRGGAPTEVWALPRIGVWRLCPSEVQGAEPALGGKAPQTLKPKNTLEASQKAFW